MFDEALREDFLLDSTRRRTTQGAAGTTLGVPSAEHGRPGARLMCGISGVLAIGARNSREQLIGVAGAMAAQLDHRGPDARGSWTDERLVAFGHRRLSIIDLSENGAQPMTSADGRWVITYNGELYNTSALIDLIPGGRRSLRGHSDTEILLEAIASRGPLQVLERAVGMFAFGLWDQRDQRLWLARDRFGEKPLFYSVTGDTLIFASEISALRAGMTTTPAIDHRAVASLLHRSVIPAPLTIYDGVHQVEPGCVVPATPDGLQPQQRYWNATQMVSTRSVRPVRNQDAVDELDELLERTVRSRMVSDVPLGAFLSGGIDSTTIVAMMQRAGGTARTFTIGFDDDRLNEAGIAARTAAILGTRHEEHIVTGSDALSVVPRLATIYDQPFADSSQIPTFLVSDFTSRHVTVALSGDGGDELFGGYERYSYFERLAKMQRVPRGARSVAAGALSRFPTSAWDSIGRSRIASRLPAPLRARTSSKVRKLVLMLRAGDLCDQYDTLVGANHDYRALMKTPADAYDSSGTMTDDGDLGPREIGMLLDTLDYLPSDILTKIDRAAMSVSLETRVPFLDPDVFEFAWSLHPSDRVRDGQGKWVLRELLARHVPRDVVELPKRGFGVPLGAWLRGPLRSWADDLLSADLIREHDVLEPDVVASRWQAHLSSEQDLSHEIWPVLMLQAWQATAR